MTFFGIDPMALLTAIRVLEAQDAAAEADRVDHVGPLEFPGISIAEPIFRPFDLLAVLDALIEQPELVADPVAVAGISVGCQGIEEAGSQTAEAAVAEGGIGFAVDNLVKVDSGTGQSLGRDVIHAQVEQALLELTPDQVFHRQVVDPLGIGFVLAAGTSPSAARRGSPAADRTERNTSRARSRNLDRGQPHAQGSRGDGAP